MRKIVQILIIGLMFLLTGCYPGIHGKVVDNVTGKPLDGAVVLAEWTTTWGLGLTYHKLYKIVETETDKEGSFSLSGVYNPFVDQPSMVIYKKGYVPYRNDKISFENPRLRKKVEWENGKTYRMELLKESHPREWIYYYATSGFMGVSGATPIFQKIEMELGREAQPEIELKWKKNR
jgi:hypothetical protein